MISDIDDTVKLSDVTDRRALLERTFLRRFEPVPGMPELYRRWRDAGAAFHFVSSSPWQIQAPLREFLADADFPPATLHLKQVRFRDASLFDVFETGTVTKPRQIEPLLKTFPERTFVLVGDTGEQDPEVYAALLRKYPAQITHVFLRDVGGRGSDPARFADTFAGIPPDRWERFTDPGSLALPVL